MEKTAIDLLNESAAKIIGNLASNGQIFIDYKIEDYYNDFWKAKAMFRQQIEDAAFEMLDNETCGDPSYHEAHRYTASQFYNNKYGEK